MHHSALALAAFCALSACASSPGAWQQSSWQQRSGHDGGWQDRGGQDRAFRGNAAGLRALYPHAAGWWGRPPPTLAAFSPHLATYGRWVGHGHYGRVWLPRVGPGWQPYRFGRWVNHPRWGRIWLSFDPFGWITCHYGRWGFDPRLGWFWVPGFVFAPYWAELRWSPGWIGWAPLPPPGWVGWDAGGWGYGYPGWVFAPRNRSHQPETHTPRKPDRSEFEQMVRAPALPPASSEVTPEAPPPLAPPAPLPTALPPAAILVPPGDIPPPDPVTVRPGLVAPEAVTRPAWVEHGRRAHTRSEEHAPPSRSPAVRGGLEPGASASEP
ncbi:DUF6600 domain-containing protein [Thermaurantiacus sp.]